MNMIQVDTIQPNELNNERLLKSVVTHLYLNDKITVTNLREIMSIINEIRDIHQKNLCGANIRKEMVSIIGTIKALAELAGVLIPELKERCNV